ncbi:MAG TPA: neutral/alkaline non-lysosomal ceramidase N-terminal domain-containing protein, partial [Verrucomicrobiae bacterium]
MKSARTLASMLFLLLLKPLLLSAALPVGFAKVDITPQFSIFLNGYGARTNPATRAGQHLFARAMALGSDTDGAALYLTLDNCGVPKELTDALARKLNKRFKIPRERFVLCSTHTHTGPCLTGILPNLLSREFTAEEQKAIDTYTEQLLAWLEECAEKALAARQPAQLSWAQGSVDFARNRRTINGPVDHALPVLKATDARGQLLGFVISYACHCTTLGSDYNQFHGDWAGQAGANVERDHPGAIALVSIGCGADANPFPRGKIEDVRQHGEAVAGELKRLLGQPFTPLPSLPVCRFKRIELPFSELPTREQWAERAKEKGIVGFHARKNLARLARGEVLPTSLPYAVQTWTFGDELAMIFLSGEVVVDYSLRLKRELAPARIWVHGYANEVPCYIPSRRILTEGGYEAEMSLWYYDRPARLAPATEDLIIAAVHELIPATFNIDPKQSELPPPQSAAETLASMRLQPGLKVELVASEPLVESPVAMDFGADGRLWIAEMRDYPSGLDGKGQPGGRIKVLSRSRPNGTYDSAAVFLEGIPFPTGLMAWRKGVLVCAAPDILYAEDTDGDGKADSIKKLFSGFATHNFQARVNCLRWGLDGWVYGAAGLFGGMIKSQVTGKEVELTGRDFRMRPDTGEFEPVNGLSQQGRVRDDFGNWFGCDNSTLLWHFPLPDHYLRRNPFISAPAARVYPCKDADPNQLFPASRTLARFNSPESANRTTSACGLEIFRDQTFGPEQNAFVCEPVHNLVRRMLVVRDGVTFSARKPAGEARSEFLASTDNWFRPVEARTGPDGALWVVDMYRFVIEHPRWIPADRLSQLDVRAGASMGRIYRIYPASTPLSSIPDLTKSSDAELIKDLESANGVVRDLAHRQLLLRSNSIPISALMNVVNNGANPSSRVQALWLLQNIGAAKEAQTLKLLQDANPEVRQNAVKISETLINTHPRLSQAMVKMVRTADLSLAFQLALSLGEWRD